MCFYGVLVGAIVLAAYALGEYVLTDAATADAVACTMSFATLVFCELTRAMAVRSESRSVFAIGLFSNKSMNQAFVVGLALQLAVLFIPPLQGVFNVTALNATRWLVVVGLSFVPLVVSEVLKAVQRGGRLIELTEFTFRQSD